MKPNLILPTIVLALLAVLNLNGQDIDYQFQHLTIAEGLGHTDATCIAQDTSGFIWIGTYFGLNRFDGYEVKSYVMDKESINNAFLNRINSICINGLNQVWLATQGGIKCFDISSERFIDLDYSKEEEADFNEEATKVHFSPSRHLLVGKKNGLKFYQVSEDGTQLKAQEVSSDVDLGRVVVQKIKRDFDDNYWIVSNFGLLYVSKNLDRVHKIRLKEGKQYLSPVSMDLFFSDREKGWLTYGRGLISFRLSQFDLSKKEMAVQRIDLQQQLKDKNDLNTAPETDLSITAVVDDRRGAVWIGTTNGLIHYAPGRKNSIKRYYSAYPLVRYALTSKHINQLFIDYSNCLWISTFGGGVNYIDLNQKEFHLLQYNPLVAKSKLSGNYVRALLEDEKGNVWIGTRENGLNYYDFETESYQHFKFQPEQANGLKSDNLRALAFDDQNRLWIGTNDRGINIYDPKTGRFEYLEHLPSEHNSLTNNTIFAIAKDKFGQMWAGSWKNGLNRIVNKGNGQYEIEQIIWKGHSKATTHTVSSDRISFIYADEVYPEIFVGTSNGLDRIFLKEDGTIDQVIYYSGGDGKEQSLSSNFIWPIKRVDDTTLWVGTIGGGLNKLVLSQNPGGYTAQHFSIEEGAPSADIESLLMDEKGRIWMGTKGISMFDPQTNTFRNFDANDGLQSNSFKIGAAYKGKSGRLYFGGTRGINFFYPDSIKLNEQKPKVVLTDLIVNNSSVKLGEKKHKWTILSNSINESKQIRLSHLENNFSITFASLYYANPGKCKYRYKLEGYDEDWIYTDANDRKATYSNLNFDNYVFKVSASNGDGIWSDETTQLKVAVIAPWWRTNIAYVLYGLLFLAVLSGIYYALIHWYKLKQKLEITLLEERQMEEIHQMRLQFFTNISHDFKTPLTLILNPLESLLNNKIGERKAKRYYHLMHNNAKRLLNLVNELMDFRKVERGAYRLHINQQDLAQTASQVMENFQEHATSKDIHLSFQSYLKDKQCFLDQNIFEKTLINLLGNALKNTQPSGNVQVKLYCHIDQFSPSFNNSFNIKSEYHAEAYTWLHVIDNGSGISKDSLPLIFDRYFTENKGDSTNIGSGVGLALVKSLVLLHKGELAVYSEENKGTEFLVGFPNRLDDHEQLATESPVEKPSSSLNKSFEIFDTGIHSLKNVGQAENGFQTKILIVEDNHVLRQFVKESFEHSYQVFEAPDGQEGLELARKILPDVIISDVMMPKLDGVSLCQIVKNDSELNHIPFILLTAKSSVENQFEGVSSGADYYFTKPISIRVLQATIQNLIASRKKMKNLYMKNAFTKARELAVNDKEKSFMKEFVQIIEENIERTDFDVDQLCKEIGMSRTKLYNKVKSITGKSVGELIRGLRLKRAAQILASEDTSIVQVMYRVGIQSQSYFTKSFKKEFGKTPTQFVNDLSNKSKTMA